MAGPKVVKLAPKVAAADPGVIEACESLLEAAKAGKIQSLAVCGESDGEPFLEIEIANDGSAVRLLGVVALLKATLARAILGDE